MSGATPPKPPRPWYRPHASTCVVMVLAVAAMTFWNVAGNYEDSLRSYARDHTCMHGWPVAYLKRDVYQQPGPTFWPEPDWGNGVRWRRGPELLEFSLGALVLDLASGAV